MRWKSVHERWSITHIKRQGFTFLKLLKADCECSESNVHNCETKERKGHSRKSKQKKKKERRNHIARKESVERHIWRLLEKRFCGHFDDKKLKHTLT